MSILDLLFGNSNEPEDEQVTVVDTATGWTGTYPGTLTEEVAGLVFSKPVSERVYRGFVPWIGARKEKTA